MVRCRRMVAVVMSMTLALAGSPVGALAQEVAVPGEQGGVQEQTVVDGVPATEAAPVEEVVEQGEPVPTAQGEVVDVAESDSTASAEEVLSGDEPSSATAPDNTALTPQSEGDALTPQSESSVRYRTHVQRYGWQGWRKDGATSGTSGKSKRLEGIRIALDGVSGGIEYRTHVQRQGWQGWRKNGAMSGTSGKSLRLEAIQIRLTGAAAESYDVYYRVHAQRFGWMGWACNGASAGTAGYSFRLEAIQIVLVPKGQRFVGSTESAFREVIKSISGKGWRVTMPSSWGSSAGFTMRRNESYGPYFNRLWSAGNKGSVWNMFETAVASPTGKTVRLKSGQTVNVFTGGGFGSQYVIPIHNINARYENLYISATTFNALRQLAACTVIDGSFSNP